MLQCHQCYKYYHREQSYTHITVSLIIFFPFIPRSKISGSKRINIFIALHAHCKVLRGPIGVEGQWIKTALEHFRQRLGWRGTGVDNHFLPGDQSQIGTLSSWGRWKQGRSSTELYLPITSPRKWWTRRSGMTLGTPSLVLQPQYAGQDLGKCGLRDLPHTPHHLPNPANQSFRDTLPWSWKSQKKICIFSPWPLVSFSLITLPPSVLFQGSAGGKHNSVYSSLSTFWLSCTYVIHLSSISGRVYCMSGTVQHLRDENMNKKCPCPCR